MLDPFYQKPQKILLFLGDDENEINVIHKEILFQD